MRLARWHNENGDAFGSVTPENKLVDLTGVFGWQFPDAKSLIGSGLTGAELTRKQKGRLGGSMKDVRWLAPVENPGKIICVGFNFPERISEIREAAATPTHPSLFIRFPATLVAHEQPLVKPRASEQYDYEGELAVVIGKSGRRIPEAQAHDHIFGLTLMNDGSVRDWMRHGMVNVTQGKNFEKSGSIGPWIVTTDALGDLSNLDIVTRVNGEVRQRTNSGRMLFSIARVVSYVSAFITLEAGDIIAMGAPGGGATSFSPPKWLKAGDVVEVECPAIGVLRNTVAEEAS